MKEEIKIKLLDQLDVVLKKIEKGQLILEGQIKVTKPLIKNELVTR